MHIANISHLQNQVYIATCYAISVLQACATLTRVSLQPQLHFMSKSNRGIMCSNSSKRGKFEGSGLFDQGEYTLNNKARKETGLAVDSQKNTKGLRGLVS